MSEYSLSMFNQVMLLANEENHEEYFVVQRICIKGRNKTSILAMNYCWEHFCSSSSGKEIQILAYNSYTDLMFPLGKTCNDSVTPSLMMTPQEHLEY